MNTQVLLLLAQGLLLLAHVRLVLVVDKVHNRGPAVAVVDIVAKARSVNDGQLDVEATLLQVSLENVDLGGLVELLGKATARSATSKYLNTYPCKTHRWR